MIIKKTLIAAASLSILSLGILTVPAYATGPEFTAKLQVRNLTTGTEFVDANDEDNALRAAPGDTLEYNLTLTNNSAPDPKGSNNVTFMSVYPNGTDIGDAAENAGGNLFMEDESLAPGKSVTRSYTAKVTSNTHDDILIGAVGFYCSATACPYVHNNSDLDYWDLAYAVVKTHNDTPATNPTPGTTDAPNSDTPEVTADDTPIVTADITETPQTPTTPEAPANMPNTGSSAGVTAVVAVLATVGGYILNTIRLRRSVR